MEACTSIVSQLPFQLSPIDLSQSRSTNYIVTSFPSVIMFSYIYGLNYFYLQHRWKGENVATTEVELALLEDPQVESANVYGVKIEGKRSLRKHAHLIFCGLIATCLNLVFSITFYDRNQMLMSYSVKLLDKTFLENL